EGAKLILRRHRETDELTPVIEFLDRIEYPRPQSADRSRDISPFIRIRVIEQDAAGRICDSDDLSQVVALHRRISKSAGIAHRRTRLGERCQNRAVHSPKHEFASGPSEYGACFVDIQWQDFVIRLDRLEKLISPVAIINISMQKLFCEDVVLEIVRVAWLKAE